MKKIYFILTNFVASLYATDFAITADQYEQIKQRYITDYQECKNSNCDNPLFALEPEMYMRQFITDEDSHYRAINAVTQILISKEFNRWKRERTKENSEKLYDRIEQERHVHYDSMKQELPESADKATKYEVMQRMNFFKKKFHAFAEQFIIGNN